MVVAPELTVGLLAAHLPKSASMGSLLLGEKRATSGGATVSYQLYFWRRSRDVLIRNNDSKSGTEFDRVTKGAGMKIVRTAPRMNAM